MPYFSKPCSRTRAPVQILGPFFRPIGEGTEAVLTWYYAPRTRAPPLCMSLAPRWAARSRQGDHDRADRKCLLTRGASWLWRAQGRVYGLSSPAQPPPGPSHLPRRSTAGSPAAVARRARSRRRWARHARCAPHPPLVGPLPPPQCATRCPAGRSASWARLTVVPGSGHRIPALGTVRAAAVSSNG